MTRLCWWLAGAVSRVLDPCEREVLLGDLAESRESGVRALYGVMGLAARRQAELWRYSRPWLILVGLTIPLALLISLVSIRVAGMSAVYSWMYLDNTDWPLLQQPAFWMILGESAALVLPQVLALVCISWTLGFMLGALSRPALPGNAAMFALMLLFGQIVAVPWYLRLQTHAVLESLKVRPLESQLQGGGEPSWLIFCRLTFPLFTLVLLALLPSLWGMYQGVQRAVLPRVARTMVWAPALGAMTLFAAMHCIWWIRLTTRNWTSSIPVWQTPPLILAIAGPVFYIVTMRWKRWRVQRAASLFIAMAVLGAAEQPATRATLLPAAERKPAPAFALQDAALKTIRLADYRGKVVLLDFWATWCTGCKKEIPWFSAFQKAYASRGFAVVGVSLDQGGWTVLRPFLEHAKVPYQMLLGDDSIARRYGIETMPDTFLIDRQGRIAAAYKGGLVDQDDIEAKIRTLLTNR